MNNVIEPNIFKMRLKSEMPIWKKYIWRIFGTKQVGYSDEGHKVVGYWLRGVCLVYNFEEIEK